ncbi:CDP-glycerol glycerophosphotransferase family protein [Peribacillus frigoritolerans]|nr:CDP-glycerol glycerophosphotransferase family protein [Peribacillus frigoritolerans]
MGKPSSFRLNQKNISAMIRSIYHLATSKWIIIDNYFGFLSAIAFKKQVTCVQVWHAAGAVKQFGAKDPSIKSRSAGARKRFF